MLRLIVVITLALVFALGATLGFTNGDTVSFHYLFGVVDVRLAVLVLLAFAAGALVSGVLAGLRLLGAIGETRRLRRQLRDAETELKNLRNLPATRAATPVPAALPR